MVPPAKFGIRQDGFYSFLTMDTAADVKINSAVVLANPLTITGSGTGDLTFAGAITGTDVLSRFVASGAGTVTLKTATSSIGGEINVTNGSTLLITDGGQISTGTAATAASYITNGTVRVGGGTGESMWNNFRGLVVTDSGNATMDVIGGGYVFSYTASIADGKTGVGVVNVGGGTGESEWSIYQELYVGNRGTGTLNIQGGGAVENSVGIIGNFKDSIGRVTVGGGTGLSAWENSAHMVVGQDGNGTMDIVGGGTVSNTTGYIAYGATSIGEVNIGGGDGAAAWINSADLNIANSGTGKLKITGGGTVSNVRGYIGEAIAGDGEVEVGGGSGNSLWANSGILFVGVRGHASLSITGGGRVTNTIGIIGDSMTDMGAGGIIRSQGTVNVGGGTGTSSWENSGHLVVGQDGNGIMNITSGGTVTNTMGFIAYGNKTTGTVTVGAISGTATWINSGTLSVGYGGTGILNINTGGVVQATGLIDGNAQSRVVFNGGTLRITETGDSANIIGLQQGGGTIDVATGKTFTQSGSSVSGSTGTLTKTGQGTLALSGVKTYSGGTILKEGNLNISGNSAIGSGSLTLESGIAYIRNVTSDLSNQVILSGGAMNRQFSAGSSLANSMKATSRFTGGAADTRVAILAGTASQQTTIQASFFSSQPGIINDNIRSSDIYNLSVIPSAGVVSIFALELAVEGEIAGARLAWRNDAGSWVNANQGNTFNFPTLVDVPFNGSFAQFQAINGTDLNNQLGAWGSYLLDGSTYTWAVVNHNGLYAVVPEPSVGLLLSFGLGLVTVMRRQRRGCK